MKKETKKKAVFCFSTALVVAYADPISTYFVDSLVNYKHVIQVIVACGLILLVEFFKLK